MGGGGDYQYFAIQLDSGHIVQGWEPELEDNLNVAESFGEFIEKLVTGEVLLVV